MNKRTKQNNGSEVDNWSVGQQDNGHVSGKREIMNVVWE